MEITRKEGMVHKSIEESKAKRNSEAIESEIQSLESGHWHLFNRLYKDFWSHAREISQMFKTLKPLGREDRERLWEKFSSVCEDVKREQNSEHEDREVKSKLHRSSILSETERARPQSLFGFMPPDIDEMKALGKILRDAGRMLSEHKSEMYGEHKQECFDRIQEIRKIHDAWWEDIKGHKAQRREDFHARVRANLDRNRERHSKATQALESCRRSADDLRCKIDTAWNEDWRYKAEGWLSDLEDRIRNIEDYIEKIEEWIREDEEKLN